MNYFQSHSSNNHDPDYVNHSNGANFRQPTQTQMVMQQQRSAEASAQMVYDVYGNVIGILEEQEMRELKKSNVAMHIEKSETYDPRQSHKSDHNVRSQLETQLLIFEIQLQSCRSDIRDSVVKHLKDLTLQWAAGRQTHKIQHDQTDDYLRRLHEILATGSTQHSEVFRQGPGNIRGVTKHDMTEVVRSQARIQHLDKQFEDPSRKARPPKVRSGDKNEGAKRVLSPRDNLKSFISQTDEETMDTDFK